MQPDLMASIDIAVHCDVCGELYGVPASAVIACQVLLEHRAPWHHRKHAPRRFLGT